MWKNGHRTVVTPSRSDRKWVGGERSGRVVLLFVLCQKVNVVLSNFDLRFFS